MGQTILKVIDAWKWFAEAEQMFVASQALARRGHRVVIACQPESPAAERAREAGLEVEALPGLRRPRLPTTPAANALRLARILDRLRPEILHAYRSPPHVLAALARRLARRARPALLRTRAGAQRIRRGPVNRALYDRLTDAILVSSEAVARDLLAAGLRPEKIVHVPPAVDPAPLTEGDAAALRRAWGVPPGVPVLGVLGRLAAVKGHDVVVRAAARLLDRHPDLHVVFVGPPAGAKDAPPRFEALPERARLGGRLLVPGAVAHPGAALRAFDVVTIASVGSEVISRVLLESMWLGRPVVASTVGVIPEIAEHEASALLVPPGDAEALARAVDRLLSQPELGRQLGTRAHAVVAERHLPEHLADRLEAVYAEVSAATSGPR